MKKNKATIYMVMLLCINMGAQNILNGTIINGDTEKPLQNVFISIKQIGINTLTDINGNFKIHNIANGKHFLTIYLKGYESQNFPIQLSGKTINLGIIMMYEDISESLDFGTITITDDELNDDTNYVDNISGLLQFSKDSYLRTAAFEWSSSFFKIRGLGSENNKVLINGFEMNNLFNGRPQWSNWGGLNDVLRNQEFSIGLTPSNYIFGGVLGSTNINTRASEYKKGTSISYASSNRSYSHRIMATYSIPLSKKGWAITVSANKRYSNEGYINGTSYNAYSVFTSIEKLINEKHSLNLSAIYAQNSRGKSAANTEQVYNIKGLKYNPYWGYQNGKIRNSRIKRINEPIIMLNHYWTLTNRSTLNTGIAYQFGEIGNSRIDFNGGNDPDPTYYRKLPNWFLSNPIWIDYKNAYKALTNFQNDGQLNWTHLYVANEKSGDNGRFALYEDRNDNKQFTFNTILNTELTENIILTGKLEYKKLKSENFAYIKDLFGATGYLDINKFGDPSKDEYQNNLLTPNRIAKVGDRFKYNYLLNSETFDGFAQLQLNYKKSNYHIAASFNNTTYQREGLYKNGIYPGNLPDPNIPNSLGKSKKLSFFNYGIKGGITYKITGRHLLNLNAGYITKTPIIQNSFVNLRSNNLTVSDISTLNNKKTMSLDINYTARVPFITSKISGYYTGIKDDSNIAFYYAGSTNLFIQEITTGINKKHLGAELAIDVELSSSFKLKTAANIGHYTYNNNPNIVLTSEISSDSKQAGFDKRGFKNYGKTTLKNYRIPSGPQSAYSFGFEYRDPEYWFISVTGNYLDNSFINISNIKRTESFAFDNGKLFPQFDPTEAEKLLKQQKLDAYFTLNAIGGKTWRISKKKYIGFFASISNILNQVYKTGGYEQGRTSSYQLVKNDQVNSTPNFGNKYWYGRGTTYFLNINYRF
ncbi:carboxypeptidase-like regulatory domain-containing protein [Tenacibaculum halocynthiae]|uniref:carboxypeptidase-like regulatory domain-containing protein n=1 Tax=Tenacibaculum halocynthiae TaxID=1254437 RepID=UPI0038B49B26